MARNTANKGTRTEAIAVAILTSQGYVVHRCIKHVVRRGPRFMSIRNDIFGCIDIIAKRPGERTRWIQVTAGRAIGRKKADLQTVPWDVAHDAVEIWRWVAGKKFDKRTGLERQRKYFQVYHADDGFVLDQARRVWTTEQGRTSHPEDSGGTGRPS